MNLHPCPLCGESKGYDKSWNSSELFCRACCRRVAINNAVSEKLRQTDDAAWNAAAAHAQGLRERIAELENEAREQALQALASEGQWIEHTGAQQKRIAELEAQRVPQWISVTERLPEKFVEVLVCFDGQSTLCATGQYTDNHRHDVAGWCYPAENRGCTDSGDDPVVTHWMPLPLPPGERAHGIEEGKR